MRNLVRIEFCLLGVWDGETQKLLHVSITLYTLLLYMEGVGERRCFCFVLFFLLGNGEFSSQERIFAEGWGIYESVWGFIPSLLRLEWTVLFTKGT